MEVVDVIIEISKGGHIKYEYDKERNILICDRILHTPMKYPFNYGFIPKTLSEDGDPLDVVVLMDDELVPGCMIQCKILGYLDTRDNEGNDPKMIVCPVEKVDPVWKNVDCLFNDSIYQESESMTESTENIINETIYSSISNIQLSKSNINHVTLTRIKYFFQHYKDLENKKVIVGDFYNKPDAIKIYKESLERCKNNGNQNSKITQFLKKHNSFCLVVA
jgi:inorganic pyrophosphatase